jgi:hypothetical protein
MRRRAEDRNVNCSPLGKEDGVTLGTAEGDQVDILRRELGHADGDARSAYMSLAKRL